MICDGGCSRHDGARNNHDHAHDGAHVPHVRGHNCYRNRRSGILLRRSCG